MPQPDREERHDRTQLSLDEVEQLGRVLIPAFKGAIKEDLAEIIEQVTDAVANEARELNERMNRYASRLGDVERELSQIKLQKAKMTGMVIGATFILQLAIEFIRHLSGH